MPLGPCIDLVAEVTSTVVKVQKLLQTLREAHAAAERLEQLERQTVEQRQRLQALLAELHEERNRAVHASTPTSAEHFLPTALGVIAANAVPSAIGESALSSFFSGFSEALGEFLGKESPLERRLKT